MELGTEEATTEEPQRERERNKTVEVGESF
jgi:hypothetical protein